MQEDALKVARIIYSNKLQSIIFTSKYIYLLRFKGVEIEIRNKRDPIIQAGITSSYSYNFGASITVYYILFSMLLYL